jgi:hypothetical protein
MTQRRDNIVASSSRIRLSPFLTQFTTENYICMNSDTLQSGMSLPDSVTTGFVLNKKSETAYVLELQAQI